MKKLMIAPITLIYVSSMMPIIAQSELVKQPLPSSKYKSNFAVSPDFRITHPVMHPVNRPAVTRPTVVAGKPGLPRRRVGAGTR